MKVCFVDLDGVVADNSRRWQIAERNKELHYRKLLYKLFENELARPENGTAIKIGVDNVLESLFWQSVFASERIEHDTLIDGANEALLQLMQEGYHLVFLTSRPEATRTATVAWLLQHTIYNENRDTLVMKPAAFQFTKTATWKAGIIDHEMRACLKEQGQALFIDDDESNREELLKHLDTGYYTINVYESLQDAMTRDVIHVSEEDA